MITYRIIIKFKNGKDLLFKVDTEKGIRDRIEKAMNNIFVRVIHLGNYIVPKNEILYIKTEGGEFEQLSREEI
jgi:hypothetical protein